MVNRLASETSPYLRQHADNPVDWYPWGDEAFARARAEDRPVLCRSATRRATGATSWRTSPSRTTTTARRAQRRLRGGEGRPRGTTRRRRRLHGGGPGHDRPRRLAHDGLPHARRPALLRRAPTSPPATPTACRASAGCSRPSTRPGDNRRAEVESPGRRPGRCHRPPEPHPRRPRPAAAGAAADPGARAARAPGGGRRRAGRRASTPAWGGFGPAPKFPQPQLLELCLRHHRVTGDAGRWPWPTTTLGAMAAGGIYDHLGGGFARYSTDATWTVPHFEKMLYDQAGLVRVYLHAWQVTGDDALATRWSRRPSPTCSGPGRARRRAVLAPRTPTPRARRAASTCGRRPR